MKPNTALNTAFTVSKIGVYAAVALGAMACSSLRPFGQEDEFRAKLKAPEITGASQAAPQVTLPIERLPSDTFWVRPQISEGELPSRLVENLSVTERGLFDVLQLIFASTNMPLSFEGGADAASRYGVVTLNNLSGTLPQVMNKLGEINPCRWHDVSGLQRFGCHGSHGCWAVKQAGQSTRQNGGRSRPASQFSCGQHGAG